MVMLINLLTEQVGQNEWQKQQEMTIVTGTGVSGSFLLVWKLQEHIGCGIVYGNQTRMCPVHDMPACYFFHPVSWFQTLAHRLGYNDGQRQRFVVVDYSQQCHEQSLAWRQAEAVQSHVLVPEWEMKEAEGLGGFACRLADLAHHLWWARIFI